MANYAAEFSIGILLFLGADQRVNDKLHNVSHFSKSGPEAVGHLSSHIWQSG